MNDTEWKKIIDEQKQKELEWKKWMDDLEWKINFLNKTVDKRWTIKEATVDIARFSVIGVGVVGAIAAIAGFSILGVNETRKHAIYMTELCGKPENANNGICWGYYGEGTSKTKFMPTAPAVIPIAK